MISVLISQKQGILKDITNRGQSDAIAAGKSKFQPVSCMFVNKGSDISWFLKYCIESQ